MYISLSFCIIYIYVCTHIKWAGLGAVPLDPDLEADPAGRGRKHNTV